MYWTNFWQPTVHLQQNIFDKNILEVGTSNLYASFGTFCVQIGQFFEAQWVFEKCLKTVKSVFLKENIANFEFIWMYKNLLCLESLTNLNAKGVKGSVKMWATIFCKRSFKLFCCTRMVGCQKFHRGKKGQLHAAFWPLFKHTTFEFTKCESFIAKVLGRKSSGRQKYREAKLPGGKSSGRQKFHVHQEW